MNVRIVSMMVAGRSSIEFPRHMRDKSTNENFSFRDRFNGLNIPFRDTVFDRPNDLPCVSAIQKKKICYFAELGDACGA